MDPREIFPNEYVPREQASSTHKKWEQANPSGDAPRWRTFRDKVLVYKKGDPPISVPAMSTPHGDALVAAGKMHMSVTDIGSVYDPPETPPDPPPTGTGIIIWNGDLDTGNETQFGGNIIRNAADRFRVTPSADGVTARSGGYMARIECRQGEATSWASNLSATLGLAAGLPVGYNQIYSDFYLGWSAWIPSSFPWASGATYGMNAIFIEWHGYGPMIQAPFHWGINPFSGRFYIDLHRVQTGWAPVFSQQFEALSDSGVANTWHDYTVRIKWSQGSDGIITFWRNGVQQYNYVGPTAPITGEGIKGQFGMYCANNAPASKVVYLDEIKMGTTYDIVQPG
jgi:hypothetical protein